MREQLHDKVNDNYYKNDQWLNLETMYEDNGKLTSQNVCLIEKGAKHCIFCTRIRTLKDLRPSELGHTPYLIYDPDYNEFTFTIPTFTYLTKTDLANAIYYLVHKEVWCVFNIKINDWSIAEFVTKRHNLYEINPDDIKMYVDFEREQIKEKGGN